MTNQVLAALLIAAALTSGACNAQLTTAPSTLDPTFITPTVVTGLRIDTLAVVPGSTTNTDKWIRVTTFTTGGGGVSRQTVILTLLEGDGRLETTTAVTDAGGVALVGLSHTSTVVVDAAHSHGGRKRLRIPVTGVPEPVLVF